MTIRHSNCKVPTHEFHLLQPALQAGAGERLHEGRGLGRGEVVHGLAGVWADRLGGHVLGHLVPCHLPEVLAAGCGRLVVSPYVPHALWGIYPIRFINPGRRPACRAGPRALPNPTPAGCVRTRPRTASRPRPGRRT
jgi:hypothetical protein